MLNIAICDDEKYFRREINGILITYLNEKGIVHSIDAFESGEEFVLQGIEMLKYNVVFFSHIIIPFSFSVPYSVKTLI